MYFREQAKWKEMPSVTPASAEELAAALQVAGSKKLSVQTCGHNSKALMGGPQWPADVTVRLSGLQRVLQYEPNDLTISVEAGMPWAKLQELLARQRQMVALDPPYATTATVGGVVATNSSGPLRRAFGTARDLIIGMRFAMLNGKLASVGGMVVKNVAGLDIGKLMIGSFGTLAAIASVNFRLHAMPEATQTFFFSHATLEPALAQRNLILGSALRPLALDLLTPVAAARFHRRGFVLAVRAGGSRPVLARYARELGGSEALTGAEEEQWWCGMRDFPADFLRRQPGGIILRVSTPLNELGLLLRLTSDGALARAGSGVTYLSLGSWAAATALLQKAAERGWPAAVEFAPPEIRERKMLWSPGGASEESGFAMMEKIKHMFDPQLLLNRSRLYGRL